MAGVTLAIIAAMPCLAWAADTPALGLAAQPFDVSGNASIAPFVMYRSLSQGNEQVARGLQLYGATSQVRVGGGDALTWTGAYYVSKTYQSRIADTTTAVSPLDISRLGMTATWFREPSAGDAATASLPLSGVGRQLVGEDRLVFQRMALKAGSLSVSGEYLDVGAKFQGASNLSGLPKGVDAKALEKARGIDSLNLAAALDISSGIKISSELKQVSNLQAGSKDYGLQQRDLTHRLEAKLGGGTDLSMTIRALNDNAKGQLTDSKTTTLSLKHEFGQGRTFALTDKAIDGTVSDSETHNHTRTFDLAWAFDPRLKAAATLTDSDLNGVANRTRDLRLNWAAKGTSIGLRQVAISGASAQTKTSLEVGTRLLGGALRFSRVGIDSLQGGHVTNTLRFDGSYGNTHLTLHQITRSGAETGPAASTSLKITSTLSLAGTPVALKADYGRDLIDPKTQQVSDPGVSLQLIADRPGFNLITDLSQRDRGGFGGRFYLVRDPRETTGFGLWGDLAVAMLSANEMNRSNYEHTMQLGGCRFTVGQRMVARTDGQGQYPTLSTNFDLSREDLPAWASTLSAGSMFGGDGNYEFAVVPGVQSATGKTGLRVGLSRHAPGGTGLVQTLDYAAVLGGDYLLRLYLGRAAGNVPVGAPARSRLIELSSRYHDKLSWVLRLTSDRTQQGQCAGQAFGLRGQLSAHETLALTLLRRSALEGAGGAFGLDYSRHISDDHYLRVKAQYEGGRENDGYRIDLAYQRAI